jgi:hypothetical protein
MGELELFGMRAAYGEIVATLRSRLREFADQRRRFGYRRLRVAHSERHVSP